MKIGFLIVLFLACSSVVCGQDPNTVSPDRPNFSSGAHLVPAGRIQLEGGASYRRFGDVSGYEVGELLIRAGISSRVEVRAGLPSYMLTHANGVESNGADDAVIEGKILLKSGDKGAASLMPSFKLPTGTRSVSEHAFQPGGILISDVNISRKIVVTTNFGYYRISIQGERHDLTFAVSTLHFALARNVNIYSEFYAQSLRHGWLHRYAATGATWNVNRRTAVDLSGGIGFSNHAHGPDYYYSIGISRLF